MNKKTYRGISKTGAYKNPNDLIMTPEWVIKIMWDWAFASPFEKLTLDVGKMRIIDPCAGDGRIIDYGRDLGYSFESLEIELTDALPLHDYRVRNTDFFTYKHWSKDKYHIALLNPPFSKLGAFRFPKYLMDNWVKEIGKIITVVPAYILDQNMKRKSWLNRHVTKIGYLPTNTFAPYAPALNTALIELKNQGADNISFINKPDDPAQLKLFQ